MGVDLLTLAGDLQARTYSAEAQAEALAVACDYFVNLALATGADQEKGRALSRLNLLFLNSFRIQDFKTCLAIQKEINRMMGL
jgi:hypothetical protein